MNRFSFVNSTVSIPHGGLIGGIYFCCETGV